jgi:hypothetical protein
MKLHLLLCAGMLMGLAGCGTPGAPQPPSLKLPKPVDDLAARRKGPNVLLTWTPPTQTTDRENIRQAGKTEVCRSAPASAMSGCGAAVATLADAQVEHWTKSTIVGKKDFTDTLPPGWIESSPTGFATYALDDFNARGKSAGLSNQVKVPLAPTLDPPSDVQVKVTGDGIELRWTETGNVPAVPKEGRMGHPNTGQPNAGQPELSFFYRVFRQTQGENKPEALVGEVKAGENSVEFVDRNFEWEKTYDYRIEPVTLVKQASGEPIEVEGEDAPPVAVDAKDVFPPAVPTGLQAVFSGVGQKPFIDLTWAPNLEQDLAGYNVYRHEAGGQPAKVNSELVKTPAFRDDKVQTGREYFYTISAVDQRGNESGRSEETRERTE